MKNIPFSAVRITDGFWKQKQELVRNVTAQAVYDRFAETGRFAALRCDWQPGQPLEPHIFWDSDVAKWIEGVAYMIKEKDEPALRALARKAIDDIIAGADEYGYFNSCYQTHPEKQRFTRRDDHELYCAGHLMEAAVAWADATGEKDFLAAMCKYADYIDRIFRQEGSAAYVTPGHPELELALIKLARATGEEKYFELAKFFIDKHGDNDKDRPIGEWAAGDYNQDKMPLRQRSTVDGHSVRALYLLSAMADVAAATGDAELTDAARRCFANATGQRMYITGAQGSTHLGEAYTADYHLPNAEAYAETCAAIALALFGERMQQLGADSRHADAIERVLYNGALAGLSLDGTAFFYENPLALDPERRSFPATVQQPHFAITQRVKVFSCSCCPPNIVRFIPSIGNYLYSLDGDTLYVNQYMTCEAAFEGVTVRQTTAYPADGTVSIHCTGADRLALRIPGWCSSFTLNAPYTLKNGYAMVDCGGAAELTLTLDMPVVTLAADPRVREDAGRIAVARGPVVYCMEAVDNGDISGIRLAADAPFAAENAADAFSAQLGVPTLTAPARRPVTEPEAPLYRPAAGVKYENITARFIPYFAFANRGESAMQVWVLED